MTATSTPTNVVQPARPAPTQGPALIAELIDRFLRYDGPPEQFLADLIAAICQTGGAAAGAILRLDTMAGAGEKPRTNLLALHPPLPAANAQPPAWLGRASGALASADPTANPDGFAGGPPFEVDGPSPRQRILIVPLRAGSPEAQPVLAFVLDSFDIYRMEQARHRLPLLAGLVSLFDVRMTIQQRTAAAGRMKNAMEVLAAVNEHDRFTAAAMALCNMIAARWQAERVCLGLLKGRYVRIRAISHTEKFTRKTKLAQDIESAMEECLDQDEEVQHPAPPGATVVSRAAVELSAHHGPTTVLSLPLRKGGKAVGAVTVERAPDKPMTVEEFETLRLVCDLCTQTITSLAEHDRWIGARLATSARHGLAALVGPQHTWAKLVVIGVIAATLFFIFVKGSYRVEGSFQLQAIERRIVPAPFDSYLETVEVEPGVAVVKGQVLATLDSSRLRLELVEAQAQQSQFLKEADKAMKDSTADYQIALAQARRAEARAKLLQHQIEKAKIVAPIDGVVLAGDLKRKLGAPVQTGDTLFELAPLDAIRAELSIPEADIADLRVGQRGFLATNARPDQYIEFEVDHINPVAETLSHRNVFRVRARLIDPPAGVSLNPGLEGVAKVDIDRRSYLRIWTHDLERWVRMKLWI